MKQKLKLVHHSDHGEALCIPTTQLSNPDTTGAQIKPAALAEFQGQLDLDPDYHFPAVDLQIFGRDTSPSRVANMQGFVKSYFNQRRDVKHLQKIMYYFAQDQLPVLTNLALEFAVFNRWFASIPSPTICNRAFAHYGNEGNHTIFNVNTALLGGAARPSLY